LGVALVTLSAIQAEVLAVFVRGFATLAPRVVMEVEKSSTSPLSLSAAT
jgi:hypothetical protein